MEIPFSGVANAVGFYGADLFYAEFADIAFVPAEPGEEEESTATTYWI